MPRTAPQSCPKPPASVGKGDGWVEKTYEIRQITPLFGGGRAPGRNDQITPIRVPSIKGQLRFSWRATRGARFETIEALRGEEVRIWGTTDNPSKVRIAVRAVDLAAQREWARYERRVDGRLSPTPRRVNRDYSP